MFADFKKRCWGEKVYSAPVRSAKSASVYVWSRGGSLSLNIKSEHYSYMEGIGGNHATLTFEPEAVESLIAALAEARNFIRENTSKVHL